MEENVSKFLVEGCHTKESFVRDSLIEIYSAIDAPVSIDSIELSDVYESTYQILGQTSDYEISYTAEIGYDRQEQYVDTEEVYDKDLQRRITKNVIKTRTVTDWQPYNGTVTKKGAAFNEITNDDTVDLGDLDEITAIRYGSYSYEEAEVTLNGSAVDPGELVFIEPTDSDIYSLISHGAIRPTVNTESEMPGDRSRNVRIDYKVHNTEVTVFAVKRFKAAFDFEGQTHFAKQFTTEHIPQIYCSYTEKDNVLEDLKKQCEEAIANDPEYKANTDKQQKMQYGFFGGVALIVLGMIISAIAFIAAIGLVACIACGIMMSKCNKIRNARKKEIEEKYEALKKDHKKELQRQKAELLNARLAMMGEAPLSEDEMQRFKLKNSHYLSHNYSKNGDGMLDENGNIIEEAEETDEDDDE